MCYRQTPSQHTQTHQHQQAKDATEGKPRDRDAQAREDTDHSADLAREKELEVD